MGAIAATSEPVMSLAEPRYITTQHDDGLDVEVYRDDELLYAVGFNAAGDVIACTRGITPDQLREASSARQVAIDIGTIHASSSPEALR